MLPYGVLEAVLMAYYLNNHFANVRKKVTQQIVALLLSRILT